MSEFFLCFVPLFVAVDPIGVVPIFINLTQQMDIERRRGIVVQTVLTATVVAFLFILVGKSILRLLGITVADFLVAGGALLFVLSLSDLLALGKREVRFDIGSLGAVPIGVPLVVGPAVLTTAIVLVGDYGYALTFICTVLNIILAGACMWFSSGIERLIGKTGTTVISKLVSLLLAAIGVSAVRRGILMIVSAP